MLAKYAGNCAACGERFSPGMEIKARYTYDRARGDFVRHPGQWSHKTCPKKVRNVDPETGEIIEVLQYVLGAEPVDYDTAISDTQVVSHAGPAFTRRKKRPQRRAGVGQDALFEMENLDRRGEPR